MNAEDQTPDIVELLALHEEEIASLYDSCSLKYPEYKDFWQQLSGEEKLHASIVRSLKAKTLKGTISFQEGRFKPQAIQTSINYVRLKNTEIQKTDANIVKALSSALDIEKGMIERKFFEVFKGDSKELKNVLTILEKNTKEHAGRIQETLGKTRKTLSNVVASEKK